MACQPKHSLSQRVHDVCVCEFTRSPVVRVFSWELTKKPLRCLGGANEVAAHTFQLLMR